MKYIIALLSVFITILSMAQETEIDKETLINSTKKVEEIAPKDTVDGWKKGGVFTLNFSNVGLQNWAAGGSNSYSITGMTGLFANLKKGNTTWDNNLDLGLGAIQQFTANVPRDQRIWVKSDDKLDFSSKYGQKASKQWYYSGLLNFKSQFLPGYTDPYANNLTVISNFFAPAYGIVAIGMDFKPNDNITVFMAPLTNKTTIVADDSLASVGAFGVTPGQKWRLEYGAYARIAYKKEVMKNVNFSSRLELFANYQDINNIDVNWETLTSMKVNDYITATFTTQLIYDNDIKIGVDENNDGVIQGTQEIRSRVQFKHVLGIGFTYKF